MKKNQIKIVIRGLTDWMWLTKGRGGGGGFERGGFERGGRGGGVNKRGKERERKGRNGSRARVVYNICCVLWVVGRGF